MVLIENPPSRLIRIEAEKAAFDNGFRIPIGEDRGWLQYGSTTAKGHIFIAAAGSFGPWYLALDHHGVIAELDSAKSDAPGPGAARYAFETLGELYAVIEIAWRLGVSLPDVPLSRFEAETADLPRTTEAERLVIQRVGQNVFRGALLDYWGGRCPLTGITEPALLRASHIVPWAECESDAQRLDVHNGLLLSALWDAAFDAGLVSFDDAGHAIASPKLGAEARIRLAFDKVAPLDTLKPAHREGLAWHRSRYGFGE